ncbi:MAG: glycosyltransferase family 2 protein [bacterium]|nr:glycosyltransferase family 2 protein [bacterium]
MQKTYQKLSIVIPVFNEEAFVKKCLERVVGADSLGLKKELIVVDDGSTDGSLDQVRRFIAGQRSLKLTEKTGWVEKYGGEFEVVLIKKTKNQGKGAAVKTGIMSAGGEIVLIQDADLEYSPDDYPALLSPIIKELADVVYGSRFVSGRPHRVLYFWHWLGNKFVTTLSNMLTNLNFSDVEVGYKVFKKEVIRPIAKDLASCDFGFEVEVTAKIAKIKDLRIYEVGVSYWGRTYKEGKKIDWRDGVRAVYYIVKYNLFK